MKIYYSILLLTVLTVASCTTDVSQEVKDPVLNTIDSVAVEIVDTLSTVVDSANIIPVEELPAAAKEILKDPEMAENKKEIEKKFGTQWDFCTCVVKQDSVNKAFETVADEDFDQVMERSDYIDSKCKAMLTTPNTTPEERSKHQAAVAACKKAFN